MLRRHHRIALLDPPAERVLTRAGALPHHPDEWPSAADLRAAVGAPHALPADAPRRSPDGTVLHVLVGESDLDGDWRPVDEVPGLAEPAARWRAGTPAEGGAAWFARGWWESVLTWLDETVPERRGRPELVKAWGLSAVVRVPTGGADLWLKAAADGFRTEPRLTAAVARLAPALVPRVMALDPDRAWVLTEDVPGAAEGVTPEQAAEAARAVARLQLDSRTALDDLRAAGAPDRGLDGTLALLGEVLHHSVDVLTDAQCALAPTLESWLVESLRALWSGPLPDTVVHGDLHCANIARTPAGPVVFDWTDLCVSHPFFDAQLLATSAEQHDPASGGAVWAAYLEPWRAAYPDVDLDAVRTLVPVAETVFQAVTYEQLYRAQPEHARWELATFVGKKIDRLAALRAEHGG